MKQVREQVEKAEPDLIIEVDSDHFVNFFYNNLPSFCIGMAEEAQGPQEDWCPMPRYTVRGHVPLAKALFKYGVHDKFDLAAAHELRLDHSLTVPLHFLNPDMRLAGRADLHQRLCFAAAAGDPLRGAGPYGAPLYRRVGRQRAHRADRQRLFRHGRWRSAARLGRYRVGGNDFEAADQRPISNARAPATEERINAAGNNSGELLNWITVAGAVGKTKPLFLEGDEGNGYAVWKFE